MKNIVLIVSAFFISAGTAQAARSSSLAQLDAAAIVFRVAFDGEKRAGCGLSPASANALLQVTQARLDAKKDELSHLANAKRQSVLVELKTCNDECHCGVLADVVQGYSNLSKTWKAALQSAQDKAKAQTAAQTLKCAERARWVCSSGLLKELRTEVKKAGVGSPAE